MTNNTFNTKNKTSLSYNILTNLVSYLETNVKHFPILDGKDICYSYEPQYRIVALWWDTGSGYEDSEEFDNLKEKFNSYVIDYDTEDRIKGIEIFEFSPQMFGRD